MGVLGETEGVYTELKRTGGYEESDKCVMERGRRFHGRSIN